MSTTQFPNGFAYDYQNALAASIDIYHNGPSQLPANLTPFEAMGVNNYNGLGGQAYYDASVNTLYISFRGTVNSGDYFNDYQIGIGQFPTQYTDALQFVQSRVADAKALYGANVKVILTGHSLGGSLDELISAVTGYEAITYNTLGVAMIAAKNFLPASTALNIYNFRINTDPISWLTNTLFGPIYAAPSYLTTPSRNNDRELQFRSSQFIEYSDGQLDVPSPDIFHQIGYFSRSDTPLSAFTQGPGHFTIPPIILTDIQTLLNSGSTTIQGTSGADTLTGTDGADIIHGGDGNDSITAGTGRNDIYGDAGNDTLIGASNSGNQDIYLNGGAGNDLLQGGQSGNAYLDGGAGSDTLIGGMGNNFFTGGAGNDSLQGGAGNNVCFYTQGDGNDTIGGHFYAGVSGSQSLLDFTNFNIDQLTFTRVNASDLLIQGPISTDTILIQGQFLKNADPNTHIYPNGIDQIEFADNTFINRYILNDMFVDNAYLSLDPATRSSLDIIIGQNGQNNLLVGSSNPDTIIAGNMNDSLYGGGGNDTLIGGDSGFDLLVGGAGNDFMIGGAGNATFLFAATLALNGNDIVSEPTNKTYNTLDFGQWTDGGLQINLASTTNVLVSRVLGTTITPFVTTPFPGGGAGFEIAVGGSGNDAITGTSGNNQFWGKGGDDTLTGNGGIDTLTGGVGNDLLVGGNSYDNYWFWNNSGQDTIQDSGGWDNILFMPGVDQTKIAFFRQNTDLQIGYVADLSSTITVKNMFSGSNAIERTTRPDGEFLSNNDINNLIQQMASYAQSHNQSFSSLSDVENNPNLMNIIASAWHN